MSVFKRKEKNEFFDNPTEKPGYRVDIIEEDEDAEEYETYEPVNKASKKLGFGMGVFIGAAGMFVIACIVGILAFGSVVKSITLSALAEVSADPNSYESKIDLILAYLDAYYLNDYDMEDVKDGMSTGTLYSIGDKYAEYYDEEEFLALQESIAGAFYGIGVGITQDEDGKIYIYKVYEGTPAEEAGLRVNDVIVEAAGQRGFQTTDEVVEVVRGEENTYVDIVVERDSQEIPFTLQRKNIELPTIYKEIYEDDIGYIYISKFDTVTTGQFKTALDELEAEGITSLILDLRDNPGGDYDTVVAMADRVLPEGPIITTKDKNGNVVTEYSDEANKLTIPCAVLVNGNSASAAELFTAAIQDYELGPVIGTTTYGKGVVQSIFQLSDGSGMKFTTSKYYTPNGRDIDGVGVVPDIEVTIPEEAFEDGVLEDSEDTQLQKAIEILKAE